MGGHRNGSWRMTMYPVHRPHANQCKWSLGVCVAEDFSPLLHTKTNTLKLLVSLQQHCSIDIWAGAGACNEGSTRPTHIIQAKHSWACPTSGVLGCFSTCYCRTLFYLEQLYATVQFPRLLGRLRLYATVKATRSSACGSHVVGVAQTAIIITIINS